MEGVEERTEAERKLFDQCMLGGISQKGTCISHTLVDLSALDEAQCDGNHVHGRSVGMMSSGEFASRRLQEYPSELCRVLAEAMLFTLLFYWSQGAGPGWSLKTPLETKRVSNWSRYAAVKGLSLIHI